jgi:tetratricopeptide (TPR) repeat protein
MKNNSSTAERSLRSRSGPAPSASEAARVPWWLRLAPLWIVIAVLAVYIRVLGFDFIGFDDLEIIKQRYFIIGHLSNLKVAFTTDAFLGTTGSFYRPLQTVSFMVDAFLGGPNPFVYHLTNLVLHSTASLCVLWLLLTLGYTRRLSLLLGLLFALHPMFVLMVGWVPARGDLLLTVFVILSFVLFVQSFRRRRPALLFAHQAAFFLAFLSKETAVALPALCLVFYYSELRKSGRRNLLYQYLAGWAVVGGGWYYLRSLLPSGQLPGDTLGLAAFARNLRMLPEMLGKLFVPCRFQLVPLFHWTDTAVGLAATLLLALLVVRTGQQSNRRIRLGCLWFLLFLLPAMMFRNGDAQYIFDYLYHRSYLPAVGVMIALAELLTRAATRDGRPMRVVALGSLPILTYCGIVSFHEVGYYRGAIQFFTEAIARTPRNALCYNNRGVYYGNEKNNHQAALGDFNKAIEVFPAYVVAILNRGVTHEKLGQEKEAVADLDAALRFHPNDPDTIFRLANLRYLLNDFVAATADYDRLLAMDKLYPRIYSKKAGSEAMLGRAEEARRDAEHALQVDARDEEAYNNRGLTRRLMGNLDGAKSDFDEAIRIKNDYSRPFNNRATIHLAQGDAQRALRDLDKAIQLDPLFAEAYSNRGSVEHQLGQNEAALKDLDAALRLSPSFADAYQNRGVVRNVLRQFPGALADFNQAIQLKPGNGGAYLGRGIAKLYLGDRAGASEDWKQAVSFGSKEAASLLAEQGK